jgi:hypothetical protein
MGARKTEDFLSPLNSNPLYSIESHNYDFHGQLTIKQLLMFRVSKTQSVLPNPIVLSSQQ